MEKIKCSECGATENVKPAREYPDLDELLIAWHARERAHTSLLCPRCAAAICGDLRGETVNVIPEDLPGDKTD